MRIEFDYDFFEGQQITSHFIDTDDSRAMRVVAGLNGGTIAIVGSGWEEATKHPAYPGKTRLEVVNAEMKRLGVTA